MMLPEFVPTIDQPMRQRVGACLDDISRQHNVRILFAIESGSRAWGFPSPDSDFDVRFVYVHDSDWYLNLLPQRDVIELPIDTELDVGGWELRKALNLLLKPNPVLLEWLSSPIRYLWDEAVCARLTDLANRTAHAPACGYHYRHLGEGQWRAHIGDADEVNYKKYFYALRPALALRWVRMNPDRPPPMAIQAMSNGLGLDAATIAEIDRLLEIKAETRETGLGARLPLIDQLIQSELDQASTIPPCNRDPNLPAEAETLFRQIVKGSA